MVMVMLAVKKDILVKFVHLSSDLWCHKGFSQHQKILMIINSINTLRYVDENSENMSFKWLIN